MPASQPSSPPSDFFDVAIGLGLLPASVAEPLRRRCSDSGQSPAQLVASSGLLNAVDIDIVETLSRPTETIPGYRIEGLIGKGGMGVVYRAEQRNLGRTVALKTILVSRMAERGVLDRFEREARSIGQLRHPNIIAAHDFGRHDGRVFLAMELIEGTDLDHRIREGGPFDEWLAWGLARQAAAGLSHAAQHHIVHRDIKPANLMLVPPPEGYPLPPGMPMVKIADFGLALLQSEGPVDSRLTAPDSTVGSPHYMAPEQLESSDVDLRADLYALGATLYQALTGQPPFSGMKLSQLIAAKLGPGAPPIRSIRPDLSPATCELIDRLLSRDPAQRPPDYPALFGAIDAVLGRLGVGSPAAGGASFAETTIPDSPADCSAVTATLQTARTLLSSELKPALQSAPVGPRPRARLSRRVWLAGLGLVAIALAIGGWSFIERSPEPLPTERGERRIVGDVVPLFLGVTLDGWKPVRGHWGAAADDAVLAGRDGLIERWLPTQGRLGVPPAALRDEPPLYYRLDLILNPLPSGAAAEVQFGLTAPAGRDATAYILRRDASGLSLGSRTDVAPDFIPESRISPRALRVDETAAIELERLPTGWFLEINGTPFGAVPLQPQEQPRFRLAAEGEAQFAELYLQAVEPRLP